jgi:hypothetical protein
MAKAAVITVAVAAGAATAALLVTLVHKKSSKKGPSQKQLDKLETVVLKNRNGAEVHITPVGASIQRLIVPVGQEKRDVVLGFTHASTYAVSSQPSHASRLRNAAHSNKQQSRDNLTPPVSQQAQLPLLSSMQLCGRHEWTCMRHSQLCSLCSPTCKCLKAFPHFP